jgi:hypothetical protein
MKRVYFCLFMVLLFASGCAPCYRQVLKERPAYNSKKITAPEEIVYNATLNALCKRNFIIESEDLEKGFILAKRSFQSGRRTTVLLVQGKIVPVDTESSTLYLNAIETREVSYIADRTRFFMFIIPLPGGGGKEASSIKEGEKSIQDRVFYLGLFKAIEKEVPFELGKKEAGRLTQIPKAEEKNTSVTANP